MRVPRIAKRSNQSILKEINPEYSLKRTDAEAEIPIRWPADAKSQLFRNVGKLEVKRRRGQQRMRWLNGITDSMGMSSSKLLRVGDEQGGLACCSPRGRRVGHD